MKKLSIIIPVYNEAKTIGEVIRVIHNLQLISGIEKEVIVVNDCSKDDSKAEISKSILAINSPFIKLCEHAVNKGKEHEPPRSFSFAAPRGGASLP